MADLAVTAQDLIDNTISRRKDVDKTVWGDTELLSYVNKAIDSIGMMLIYLESELSKEDAVITLTADAQEYVFASEGLPDFWAMSREGVYFATVETPLAAATYNTKIRNLSTTTLTYPTSFYITSNSIGLIPIPTTGATCLGATLNCRYYKKPTVLTADDSMPYGNIFNEAISMFTDSMAALRDDMDITAYQEARVSLETLVLKIVRYRNPIGPKGISNR